MNDMDEQLGSFREIKTKMNNLKLLTISQILQTFSLRQTDVEHIKSIER